MRLYMGEILFVIDLFLDPETQTLQSYTMAMGNCNKK